MDHYDLSDELRQQLLESAAWGKAGIKPVLAEETKQGVVEEAKAAEAPEDTETPEEVIEEEVHVCPLCTSQLDEEIESDRLLEHLDVILSLTDRLSQLQEGDEDIDEIIAATIDSVLYPDEDEE